MLQILVAILLLELSSNQLPYDTWNRFCLHVQRQSTFANFVSISIHSIAHKIFTSRWQRFPENNALLRKPIMGEAHDFLTPQNTAIKWRGTIHSLRWACNRGTIWRRAIKNNRKCNLIHITFFAVFPTQQTAPTLSGSSMVCTAPWLFCFGTFFSYRISELQLHTKSTQSLPFRYGTIVDSGLPSRV